MSKPIAVKQGANSGTITIGGVTYKTPGTSANPPAPKIIPATSVTQPRPSSDFAGNVTPNSVEYGDPSAVGGAPKKKAAGSGLDWNAIRALTAGQTDPNAGGGGVDAGLVDAIHKSHDDQVNAINQLHDAQLAHLDQLHASGALGVKQGGTDLHTQLAALAHDALVRGAQVNAGIEGTFKGAKADNVKEFASLLNDLKSHGARAGGLAGELGGANSLVDSAKMISSIDSKNQQGDLSQMLNDRQATGQQMTTGSLDDMLNQLSNAKYNAEQARTSQLASASQQNDQNMIELAKITAAAKAKQAAGKPLTASALNDLMRGAGYGKDDYNRAFDSVLHHDIHKNQVSIGAQYLQDINAGKYSAGDALAHWRSQPQEVQAANPLVTAALVEASGQMTNAERRKIALTQGSALGYGG